MFTLDWAFQNELPFEFLSSLPGEYLPQQVRHTKHMRYIYCGLFYVRFFYMGVTEQMALKMMQVMFVTMM